MVGITISTRNPATLCSSPFAVSEPHEQGSKIVPYCSTDNDFARLFSQWLQSSCGEEKSRKQSDVSVTRALKGNSSLKTSWSEIKDLMFINNQLTEGFSQCSLIVDRHYIYRHYIDIIYIDTYTIYRHYTKQLQKLEDFLYLSTVIFLTSFTLLQQQADKYDIVCPNIAMPVTR